MTSASQRQAARLLAAVDLVRRTHKGRRAIWEATRVRGVQYGGTDGMAVHEKSEAEILAEARRLIEAVNAPGTVLKTALRKVGTPEAEDLYAAACRGDEGWADRARVLLGPKAQAA